MNRHPRGIIKDLPSRGKLEVLIPYGVRTIVYSYPGGGEVLTTTRFKSVRGARCAKTLIFL